MSVLLVEAISDAGIDVFLFNPFPRHFAPLTHDTDARCLKANIELLRMF